MQSLRPSNKLFCEDSWVDMPGPKRSDKGAGDTMLGFTVSRINCEEPADTKGRWRRFMEEVYAETIANRECWTCCKCGLAKVNVRSISLFVFIAFNILTLASAVPARSGPG